MVANIEAAILERLLDPDRNGLRMDLARYILELDFSTQDHQRVSELSAKAHEGSLTTDEQRELDYYLRLGHFLALLQSKARQSLKSASTTN